MAKGLLTIGDLARTGGVPTTTLRYYEREGVLTPVQRSASGYRLYAVEAIDRLEFVRSAQSVGFTLNDIRTLLNLDEGQNKTCRAEVQRLLSKRLADVDEKMKGLKRVRVALGRALDRCRNSNGECAVLKQLRSRRKST